MSPHSCVTAKCTGSGFHQLSINCSGCGDRVYLDCIKNKPGISDLLKSLNMIDITGAVIISQAESMNVYVSIRAIFSNNSSIKYNCDKCNLKSVKENVTSVSSHLPKGFETDEIVDVKDDDMDFSLKPPKSSHKKSSNLNSIHNNSTDNPNKEKQQNESAVYVSRFDPSTECEQIKSHIMKKAAISDSNQFSVTKLLKRKVNFKNIHYVSFKITSSDPTTHYTILDEKLWEPHFTAVEFDYNYNKKSKRPLNSQIDTINKKIKYVPVKPKDRMATKSSVKPNSINKPTKPKLIPAKSTKNSGHKSSKCTHQTNGIMPIVNGGGQSQYPDLFRYPLPAHPQYHYPITHPGDMNQVSAMPLSNFHPWGNYIPQHRAHQSWHLHQPQWIPYY